MTTTQTGNPTARAGLAALAFTRRLTSGLLEGIPEDELATPPCPKGNHALWIAPNIEFFGGEISP